MRSYWDEDLAILSAENVSFSIETAGLGSRFAAFALDSFGQIVVYLLLLLGVGGIESYVFSISSLPQWALSTLAALGILVTFALFFGYYFVFEWLWDGQTPGKRFFGLRTMMANGLPLTVSASLARNAVRLVDFLPFSYGFGSLVALVSPLNQRMGDLVAGTIVVRESKSQKERKPLKISEAVDAFLSAATTVPGQNSPSTPFREDEELHIEMAPALGADAHALGRQLTREDYELARDFLNRRETLPKAARERLGQSLATRLATKLGQTPPADAEAWLGETLAVLGRVYS